MSENVREPAQSIQRIDSNEGLKSRRSLISSSRDYVDLLEENEQLKAELDELKCSSRPGSELQQQILSLELKLSALQSEYDEAEKAGYALHDYIKKAQSAWTNANARALSANQALTEADAEVQSLRSALEKAERNALAMEKEHKSEVTKLSYEIEDLKEKYSACRKELKFSKKEYTRLLSNRSEVQNKVSSKKALATNVHEGRKFLHIESPRGMIVKVDKQSLLSADSHANHLNQQITILKSEYKSLQDHYLELKQKYTNANIENSVLKKIAQDYEISRQALRELNQSIDLKFATNGIHKNVIERIIQKEYEQYYDPRSFDEKSNIVSLWSLFLAFTLFILILLLYMSIFQPL